MSIDLASVDAKLSRSTDHFDAIQNIVVPWLDAHLYGVTHKRNADCTEHRLVYWCSEELDLVRLSLMLGDAVHNLRSALDHFIYAVASDIAAQRDSDNWDSIAKTIAFPITDCAQRFGSFYDRKLRPIFANDLFDILESFQPYIRTHPSSPPYLKLVRDLDDGDKHRLLKLAFFQPTEWEYSGTFGDVPTEARPIGIMPSYRELKNGAEVATVICKCPAPNLDLNGFKVGINLLVLHEAGPHGTDRSELRTLYRGLNHEVTSVLNELHNFLDKTNAE
jgi:hypothetical protein